MPFGPEHNSTMGESLDRQVKEEEPPPWPFPTGKAPAPVDEPVDVDAIAEALTDEQIEALWDESAAATEELGFANPYPERVTHFARAVARLAASKRQAVVGLSQFDKWFEDQQIDEQHRYICKVAYEAGRHAR
jgi:hypothetical protein